MAVGSERGTTHLDVLSVDQLYCAGTITGSVQVTGTETITTSIETQQYTAGTVLGTRGQFTTVNSKNIDGSSMSGSVLNAGDVNATTGDFTHVGASGTVTGTKGHFTTGDFKALNGSVVVGTDLTVANANATNVMASGSMIGSKLYGTFYGTYAGSSFVGSAGYFEDLSGSTILGTRLSGSSIIGTQGDITTVNSKAINGSVVTGTAGNLTHVNSLGTVTGTKVHTTNLVATNGTIDNLAGSTVKKANMLSYSSGAIAVSTTSATLTHGLGGVPSMVWCVPNIISATGVVKIDGTNIGDTWFTMTANETGTATAYAIA